MQIYYRTSDTVKQYMTARGNLVFNRWSQTAIKFYGRVIAAPVFNIIPA
jgi:hypothetical protein